MRYLILMTILLVAGCSDGTSSTGYGYENNRWTPRAVAYEDQGEQMYCHKASEEALKQDHRGTIQYCSWYCAVDSTYDHKWVELEFIKKSSSKWVLNKRLVTEGNCDVS